MSLNKSGRSAPTLLINRPLLLWPCRSQPQPSARTTPKFNWCPTIDRMLRSSSKPIAACAAGYTPLPAATLAPTLPETTPRALPTLFMYDGDHSAKAGGTAVPSPVPTLIGMAIT